MVNILDKDGKVKLLIPTDSSDPWIAVPQVIGPPANITLHEGDVVHIEKEDKCSTKI